MKIIHRMMVYRQPTQDCQRVDRDGVEFRRLDEEEVLEQGQLPDDVYRRQVERLQRFGSSYCYGTFVNGELAAFAWLIPHDIMHRDVPHLLVGAPGEAELTAAETLPKYRGRGLYGLILLNLFWAARNNGIGTVLFKTFPGNAAALRSFEKVGARYVGTTYFAYLPGLKAPLVWPRRFP